jgi:TolB-like protein
MDTALKTLCEPPTPLGQVRADVSEATHRLVEQCLDKDPEKRPPDGAALLQALLAAHARLNQRPSAEHALAEATTTDLSEAVQEVSGAQPAPTPSQPQRARSASWRWAAAVFAALAAGVVLHAVLTGRGEPQGSSRSSGPEGAPRSPGPASPDAPPVADLPALARSLAGRLRSKGITQLAVLELGPAQRGDDVGAAGKHLAEVLSAALAESPGTPFRVVAPTRVDEVLRATGVRREEVTQPQALRRFAETEPVGALVTGSLRRAGAKVEVTLQAIGVPDGGLRATVQGALPLTTDLAALFGESYYRPPDLQGKGVTQSAVIEKIVEGKEPHPLSDPFSDVPYRMEIAVDAEPLPFHRDGRNLYVPAVPGKPYRIRLANRSDRAVAVALLVDGLNSIGQKREVPGEGLKWVLRPGREVELRGWQMGTTTAKEFVFASAGESLAARQGFSGDIGLLTAAFYREAVETEKGGAEVTRSLGTEGSLGTDAGAEVASKAQQRTLVHEKVPAAVLSIRYDKADAVEKMEKVK